MGILCSLLGHDWHTMDLEIDEYAAKSRLCKRCADHEFLNPKTSLWEDSHSIIKEDYLKRSTPKVKTNEA